MFLTLSYFFYFSKAVALRVWVVPCHVITPSDVLLFSYIRGLLSIVWFYWGGTKGGGLFSGGVNSYFCFVDLETLKTWWVPSELCPVCLQFDYAFPISF